MRVLVNTSTYSHWIACAETQKVIHINKSGARKVSSVCNTPIEKYTDEQLKIEIDKIKGK